MMMIQLRLLQQLYTLLYIIHPEMVITVQRS